MSSVRRQWPNSAGFNISMVASFAAIVFGILAGLSATNGLDFRPETGSASANWVAAAIFGLLFLVLGWLALQPTWSVTVGKRGIGIKKLLRQRFIDYDSFEEIWIGAGGGSRSLRIVTKQGTLTIYPRLPDAEGFAAHVKSIARQPR